MDRTTVLWMVVVFFGASVLFGVLRNLTEGEPLGVRLGVQVAALALVIGGITFFVRRQR